MALVFPGSICPICGEKIENRECFSTRAFLYPTNPLWRFSDAAMHWTCYSSWVLKEDFVNEYARVLREDETNNLFWHRLLDHDKLFITYGKIGKLDVLLVDLAVHIQIDEPEIDDWIQHPTSDNVYVQQELDRVAPELKTLGNSAQIALLLQEQQERILAKRNPYQSNCDVKS